MSVRANPPVKTGVGYELCAAESKMIPPGALEHIKTDVQVRFPKGFYGEIRARTYSRKIVVQNEIVEPEVSRLLINNIV